MSRAYDDNQTLQQKIIKGANVLADNVASTLGPRGRNVLLKERDKQPFITKDGVTVAAFVALEDPFENAGVQILRQAAVETNNSAGDGTTTSTVLARAILRESQRFIASGVSPIELQRGIDLAVREVVANLQEMSRPVKSVKEITNIATISANNDRTIGELIATAVDKVGQDGSITIEESRSLETTLDISEGFSFSAGFCAGAFITDERRGVMHYDEPLFLVTDYKISAVEQILPVLELIARENRPLVVVAEDIEGQALAAMIMNAMRGTLKVAAIKAPMYGEERRNILDDLALSSGATFVTRESGMKLQEVQLTDLGTAKSIESNKYNTTIVGGSCDYEAIEERIESLKQLIKDTEGADAIQTLRDCKRIQERIVRLSSGVAVIRVGGATEVEMTEKKHRVEDALEAVRSAQQEGIVCGGGIALLHAGNSIAITSNQSDQAYGASVVSEACREPLRQMALNANESPDIIISKVLEAHKDYGWNFRTGELVNLFRGGIIDPVKVTRTALQNAASCAGTLITTNYGIIQTE
jgi:chaperonin GroEL